MSTKEQILAAARSRYATKEIFIDAEGKVSVTVRELSRQDWDALNAAIFETGEDGKPITVNAAGDADPNGETWKLRDGRLAIITELRLSAIMLPQFTVEELQGPDWPVSLKRQLLEEAMRINHIDVKSAAGN